jgi:hypothetical protein
MTTFFSLIVILFIIVMMVRFKSIVTRFASFGAPYALSFVLITAAVALNTYLIVPNALFQMLFTYLGAGVFMTAITGVFVVITVYMTGFALCVVVSVEAEIFFVIKGCRRPVIHEVATATVTGNFLMQGIAWIGVAAVALIQKCRFDQLMGELADGAECLYAFMVAMTGYAVIFNKLLVKGNIFLFFLYWNSFSGNFSDIVNLMTSDTFVRLAAKKWCVAGKTVTGNFCMSFYCISWADHRFRAVDG